MASKGNEEYQPAREPANRNPAPVSRYVTGAVGANRDDDDEHQPQRDFGRLEWRRAGGAGAGLGPDCDGRDRIAGKSRIRTEVHSLSGNRDAGDGGAGKPERGVARELH